MRARVETHPTRAMVFQVGGTKKGGMPVTTEKRPRGKTVTVIGNVKGDKEELIRLLKSRLGCGGHAIGHDKVEIQGDHASAIQDLLLKHGGSGAMKGVAGLKTPEEAPDRHGETVDEAEKTRRATEKRAAREESDRRRARESRQRAIKEAVLVTPESSRSFHAFCAMMKRWRYWDQDYDRLHEMHHRHLSELRDGPGGENARPNSALGASFLDADDLDDNERLQSAPRSAVLETMRENLGKLDVETRAGSSASSSASAYEQLRALGMIAEPSPFRQTREERLAESRRNAAEARVRALNEARIQAARRNQRSAGPNGAVSNAAPQTPFGGYRPRVREAGGASAKRGKGDASRPTLGFTAARKRGGLARAAFGYPRDETDDDETATSASERDEDERTLGGDRDETEATTTTAAASWAPGFRRNDGGGFEFGPVEGAGATPAWAQQADGEHQSDAPSFSRAAPRAPEDPEPVSREELDLREALRLSLLEAERPPRRSAGLHVECGDVWGDLSEEEALALAMELSEQDERRRLREEREAYEAYRAEAYEADAFLRDSGDASEDARGASVEETWNDVAFSDAAFSNEASRADEGDADLAEALRLSALDAERCRDGRDASDIPRRLGDALMPEAMDEDAALREALRLSALESGGASASGVAGFADSTPGSPVAGAEETACQWAAAHLGAFTGEADNSVLAEYVVSMSRAEVEEFLGESFGDAEAAKAFARALEETR